MEDRKYKVHVTYKHEDTHKSGIEAIKKGLEKHGVSYSIDEYDIMYRDNIEKYEEEIGVSNLIVMFVIPEYLRSLDCMYEMACLFKEGNVSRRVFPVVDLGDDVPRNGDGLGIVKRYWAEEKNKKAIQIQNEPGGSKFLLGEIVKIDMILRTLDAFWEYIVHTNTWSYDELIANDAEWLVSEIQKEMEASPVLEEPNSVSTRATEPGGKSRIVNQYGDNSVYLENNSGTIIFN